MNDLRSTLRKVAVLAIAPLALSVALVAPAANAAEAGSAGASISTSQAASAATVLPSKRYTLAQVKKHNKATNCWSIVGRNVYNLTGWVNKHPGGAGTIVAMCGKNGTKLFNSKHSGDAGAKAALARYKIGTL